MERLCPESDLLSREIPAATEHRGSLKFEEIEVGVGEEGRGPKGV